MSRDAMIEALADLMAQTLIDGGTLTTGAAAVLDLCGPEPLVWDVFEGGRGAKATAWRKANYLITHWSDGRFELVESYPGYQGDNIAGAFMPTLEAAQAAAQDHATAAHWANTPLGKLVQP